MKKTFTTALTLAAAGVLLLHTPRVSAQDDAPPPPPPGAQGAGGPGGPGGPGGRGGDWQQRRNEMAKTALKATDDEWSVIQPLLEKVETKMRESMAGRFGGMMGGMRGGPRGEGANGGGGNGGGPGGGFGGGRREQRENGGGPGGPGGPGGQRGMRGGGGSPEAQALTETLQKDNASADEIKAKLAALREQRKKAAAELTQAREDLKKVLNMRQEATLVSMGVLD